MSIGGMQEMLEILRHGHAGVAHPHREVGRAEVERRVLPQRFERHFEHFEHGVLQPRRRFAEQNADLERGGAKAARGLREPGSAAGDGSPSTNASGKARVAPKSSRITWPVAGA